MEALDYLTGIAVILILGIFASIIARKLRTSNILFLVLVGIFIGNTQLKTIDMFVLHPTFLISIAIFTLAIIVFDGSSKFNFRELDALTTKTFEVVLAFMLTNILIITIALNIFYYGFTAQGIIYGIILAILMAGTDPASTFMLLGDKPHRVLQFLKIEALINTPIMVLFPFLLIDLLGATNTLFDTFIDFVGPFLLQVIVGIGTGVLIGAIVFKVMRKWYSESISPIAVISAALLSYILAENLGGNGVLAVAILGLLFGNSYVKQKGTLLEFSSIMAYILQIIVFVMIGVFVHLPSDPMFWIVSGVILIATLISRYLAISFVTQTYDVREKIFMTLTMPKGIAVAVVVFALTVLKVPEFDLILNLTIILLVYSLVLSTVATRFSKVFLKEEITKTK